jgi:hypothetical protein
MLSYYYNKTISLKIQIEVTRKEYDIISIIISVGVGVRASWINSIDVCM